MTLRLNDLSPDQLEVQAFYLLGLCWFCARSRRRWCRYCWRRTPAAVRARAVADLVAQAPPQAVAKRRWVRVRARLAHLRDLTRKE